MDAQSREIFYLQQPPMLRDESMNNLISSRVQREQKAHTDNNVLSASYKLKNKFKHIGSYPSRKIFDNTFFAYLENLNGKKVLDYGCGWGDLSLRILENRGVVYGIDISEVYINQAKGCCSSEGYDSSTFQFYVMDAHMVEFPKNYFDIIVGLGILHHLDMKAAFHEIRRVLKPGGRILFQEPLADNPLLKVFRKLTPAARTTDEKPLTGKDITQFRNSPDWHSEISFCGLVEAPIAMLTSILIPGYPHNLALKWADWLETKFHRADLLNSWNQYVLINLVKR